ncbi:hypothetical protein BDZ89DRAFT_356350 [Hymenopellis radicata]|nr:hypothetical protein BDZ89DRAFT_356350 [Hymenopellis radicata]
MAVCSVYLVCTTSLLSTHAIHCKSCMNRQMAIAFASCNHSLLHIPATVNVHFAYLFGCSPFTFFKGRPFKIHWAISKLTPLWQRLCPQVKHRQTINASKPVVYGPDIVAV